MCVREDIRSRRKVSEGSARMTQAQGEKRFVMNRMIHGSACVTEPGCGAQGARIVQLEGVGVAMGRPV